MLCRQKRWSINIIIYMQYHFNLFPFDTYSIISLRMDMGPPRSQNVHTQIESNEKYRFTYLWHIMYCSTRILCTYFLRICRHIMDFILQWGWRRRRRRWRDGICGKTKRDPFGCWNNRRFLNGKISLQRNCRRWQWTATTTSLLFVIQKLAKRMGTEQVDTIAGTFRGENWGFIWRTEREGERERGARGRAGRHMSEMSMCICVSMVPYETKYYLCAPRSGDGRGACVWVTGSTDGGG